VSYMLPNRMQKGAVGFRATENDNDSTYQSDFFGIVGTCFLWVFFPSFNGAMAAGNARSRAVVNTVLACSASCCCTFFMSRLLRGDYPEGPKCLRAISTGEGRLSIRDVQSATLAGAVATSSCVSQLMQPWAAILLGMLAGCMATAGHVYLQPRLLDSGIHDTTGVFSRHAMPGLLGAVSGAVAAFNAEATAYGEPVGLIFPEMASGRSSSLQAAIQVGALLIGTAVGVLGGVLTGLLLKLDFFEPMCAPLLDDPFWLIPGEEHQFPSSINKEKQEDRAQSQTEEAAEPENSDGLELKEDK